MPIVGIFNVNGTALLHNLIKRDNLLHGYDIVAHSKLHSIVRPIISLRLLIHMRACACGREMSTRLH